MKVENIAVSHFPRYEKNSFKSYYEFVVHIRRITLSILYINQTDYDF